MKIQDRIDKRNLPHSLTQGWARTPEEPDQCSLLRRNSLKLQLTISAAQGKIWLIWRFRRRGENQPEHMSLCSRHCLTVLDVQLLSTTGSWSGYSLRALWQTPELITVIEWSCSLTNFHRMVLQGGQTSFITGNFPYLITANQKCEEKHFLWVSGAQQVGQPTCRVQTSVCLSKLGEQCTLQILQHVKTAEIPIKCQNLVWELCNPFEFSRKGYGKFSDGEGAEFACFCCDLPCCRVCSTCSSGLTQYVYVLNPSTTSCHVL